ncbi:DUF2971 domain-containing protein [Capnocytophaga sputigena]|jgi:hypothetical protein|uniref:DUF2971 domain-containing protein n=1 Tax=Capnocytophaga sputigena TaxID=1019 RepID=UPI0031F5BEF6
MSKSVEQYIEQYENKVDENNAQQIVSEFDKQWETKVDYMEDYTDKYESKYGKAILIYSQAVFLLSNLSEDKVTEMEKMITTFDQNDSVKYKFALKSSLYFNLGLCWNKLGALYKNRVIESFKKYIYYLLTNFNTKYSTTAYAFRRCNSYLYQSLINEQLNLSSPALFNDPFDCPILELLNNEDDIALLVREAYRYCLKISCFICNKKLPYSKDEEETSPLIYNEMKRVGDKDEFLNTLMWAHYADNHSGVCIKYTFDTSITQLGSDNSSIISFFEDVKYSDDDLEKHSQMNYISLRDSFFLKGKQWEYENELRFLYFDMKGNGEYQQIDIPNCIEAVYFGMRCSENDRRTIKEILRGKKFFEKDIEGNIINTRDVEFYKIERDKSHFGELKAIKIT